MPAMHQTRLFTSGLTLGLQFLKYVVSNCWKMYAPAAPRKTFTPQLVSNHKFSSSSRFKSLTTQSHQTVMGIKNKFQVHRHTPSLPPLPSVRMKLVEIWDMDLPRMWELDGGAFCMSSWSADWSLAPSWQTLDGRAAARKANIHNDWKLAKNSCRHPLTKRGC